MGKREKVLLAETDAKRSAVLAKALQQRGYEVVAATDAVGALNMAKLAKPDVAVINSQLAGGGVAALRRLRSNVFTTGIPVVMLLGGGTAEAALREAGAQECVPAALAADELCGAIGRNLLQSLDFTEAPAATLAEPGRLAALAETGLLDSAPEASFDRLTRLATRLLGTSTALVTLVDKDRQFFKSQVGLAEPWASQRQTRLSHSFCQWVVSGQEKLVVGNAKEHPVLRSNLAIRDLGVIAYAGMPLQGRTGHTLGSFCAIDSKVRAWSEEELATLDDLARVTEAYAILGQARRSMEPGDASTLMISVHVAGNAIVGATRILRRLGARLGDGERGDLLEIIAEQAGHLVTMSQGRPAPTGLN